MLRIFRYIFLALILCFSLECKAAGEALNIVHDNNISSFSFKSGAKAKVAAFSLNKASIIVFNQPINVTWDLAVLKESKIVNDIQKIDSGKTTILIFKHADNAFINISKRGLEWVMEISPTFAYSKNQYIPKFVYQGLHKGHLQFEGTFLGDPILLNIPELGGRYIAVPSEAPHKGISRTIETVDLKILPSSQGIIIKPVADDVTAKREINDLIINKTDSLSISSNADKSQQRAPISTTPFFNFTEWIPDDEDLLVTQRKLERELYSTPKAHRTSTRLNLIRFYLMTGRDNESQGMIDLSAHYDPQVSGSEVYQALKGMAAFISDDYVTAYNEFSHNSIVDDKEIKLWRNAAQVVLENSSVPDDFFRSNIAMIKPYPPIIRNHITLIAIENAVRAKESIAPYLPLINEDKLKKRQKLQLEYLKAIGGSNKLDSPESLDILKKLAKDLGSKYGVLSHYTLAKIDGANNKLNIKDHIEKLEKIRYKWTGDSVEFYILRDLSKLYSDDGQYAKSLQCLRQVIRRFPKLSEKDNLLESGKGLFKVIMNKMMKTDPLEAIGLYKEYGSFFHSSEDQKISDSLVDSLIKIDLLDDARMLIKTQLKTPNISPEQVMHKNNQLALLSLLDQNADEAIILLSEGDPDPDKSKLLLQAYMMKDDYVNAEKIIETDDSVDAQLVRLDIYTRQKDWPKLSVQSEKLLNKFDKFPEKEKVILNWGIAMLFQEDFTGLDNLKTKYKDVMSKTHYAEVFNLIVNTEHDGFENNKEMLDILSKTANVPNQITKLKADLLSS